MAPYKAEPKAHKLEKNEIAEMLELEVIKSVQTVKLSGHCQISYGMDGTLPFFVDYRKRNSGRVRYLYPILRMEECIESPGDVTLCWTLEANNSYWHVEICKGDREKTALRHIVDN